MTSLTPRFSVLSSFPAFSRLLAPALVGAALAGCAPSQDAPTPSTGTLNVTKYVAVGDNYTAGYSDGGLTLTSQKYSFPALLAGQLAAVNPAAQFPQALLPAGNGTGYLTLRGVTATGLSQTSRVTAGRAVRSFYANPAACGGPDTTFLYTQYTGPASQNLGIPNLGLTQIEVAGLGNAVNVQRTGQFNSYLERQLPANDNRTYLQTVTDGSNGATFFTFFMGMGDALPYVLSGGTCGTAPSTTLLYPNARKILDVLKANGRQGVIALAPTLNSLPLLSQGSYVSIQSRFPQYNPDSIYITVGASVRNFVATDYLLNSALQQLGTPQRVTLPGGGTAMLPYGLSKRNPIINRDVLDANEYLRANSPLTNLNTSLETYARTNKLPLLRLQDELFDQVAGQISVNGVVYSADPIRGNFYSLDLFSLTPRGNALMANTFIRLINTTYQANIPQVDPNNLPVTSRP